MKEILSCTCPNEVVDILSCLYSNDAMHGDPELQASVSRFRKYIQSLESVVADFVAVCDPALNWTWLYKCIANVDVCWPSFFSYQTFKGMATDLFSCV